MEMVARPSLQLSATICSLCQNQSAEFFGREAGKNSRLDVCVRCTLSNQESPRGLDEYQSGLAIRSQSAAIFRLVGERVAGTFELDRLGRSTSDGVVGTFNLSLD